MVFQGRDTVSEWPPGAGRGCVISVCAFCHLVLRALSPAAEGAVEGLGRLARPGRPRLGLSGSLSEVPARPQPCPRGSGCPLGKRGAPLSPGRRYEKLLVQVFGKITMIFKIVNVKKQTKNKRRGGHKSEAFVPVHCIHNI